jgi:hypothetical protein
LGALRAAYFEVRSRNAEPLDGVLEMISQGMVPDPQPGSVALEFEYPKQTSSGSTLFAVLAATAALVYSNYLGSGWPLWLVPVCLGAAAIFAFQAKRRPPRIEIRSDGILIATFLLGDELFIPWSVIQDVDTQPLMDSAFLLDVGDRSETVMNSKVARVVEDLMIRVFNGGKIGIMTPEGITPAKLRDIFERRILDTSRAEVGLIRNPDRENTL